MDEGEARTPPQRLDLKVGFSCNNRCIFCVQGDKREYVDDRGTSEVREILAEQRSRASGVVFTGGEATIRNDLIELVSAARDLDYQTIQIQTNGRRLSYLPYAKALIAAGATEFSPALHGSTPAIHDSLTRARGAFRQVVQGIRNVRSLGVPVITNTVVVKQNLTDLPALATLLVHLGVQQLQLAFIHPAGAAEHHFEEVVPRFTDAMPYIHRALDIARAAGTPAFTEAVPFCFMKGYEDFVVEGRIPDTCVVDAPMIIDDYTEYRWTEGKAKGAPCQECTFRGVCEGPWREYPEQYGWAEFAPRADPPTVTRARTSR